jgi:hypothetical protein
LVFEGAPVMVAPLAQDQATRRPLVTEGPAIDTRAVIPPLTSAERDIVKSLKEAARRQLQPSADRARKRSDRELAEQISKETGMHIATALRHVTARHAGKLMPSMRLEFDDGDIGIVTVGDVLDDPDRFVGETLADPLEGTAYGRCKAMVMRRDDGELFIHSFAHGRTFYDLVLDASMMRQEIDGAPPQSSVDVFVANVFRAHLEPDELAELREYVAKRAGVGVRRIDQRIKAAGEVRAKKEAERAATAAPSDGRITFAVPADDAEMTAVMERIDRVLSQVKDAEPPMRNASGAFCEIRTRPPIGLHQLMSHLEGTVAAEEPLPAPAEPLISELDVDHTTMAIERHIRHTRLSRSVTTNVRLPVQFARAYQNYSSSSLPRVIGVVTAPLVTETDVLATRGLNRDLELVFRIEPMLCRLVPEPGSVSDEDAIEAYHFLTDEWLCDVQTTKEGKAQIVVAALTLIERLLLPERPAFFVTAGQRGGGKTTLVKMISLAVLGRLASAATWSENGEERRKAMFAHLREGPSMIAWDNLSRGASVSCPVIEKALTSAEIVDRVLGHSEQVSVPATTVQFFTGNNIVPAGDMASRSLVIRLDVDRPDPENRDFQHPDPIAWTIQHRARILRALYTLLVWNPLLKLDAKERPQPKTRFKRWWTLCGAPVERVAEIDFGKILQARESEDAEVSGLSNLLRCLWEAFGDKEFTAEQVVQLDNWPNGSENVAAFSMRQALEEATGKPFLKLSDFEPRKVGKRLQMIVGRPVEFDCIVLTLQRIANAKTGNRYRVSATG